MEVAVYDLPLASVPTRKPRTPMEVPTPDLDRFNLSGPKLKLLRNRHAIRRQVYRPRRAAPSDGVEGGAASAGHFSPKRQLRGAYLGVFLESRFSRYCK